MASWTSELDLLDDTTAQLVVSMHLKDLAELQNEARVNIDVATARRQYKTELEHYCVIRGFEVNQPPQPPPTLLCHACQDVKLAADTHEAQCGHNYCASCLRRLFTDCFNDESLYPPRCCRIAFPFEQLNSLLGDDLYTRFGDKQEEFNDKSRIYCHVQDCSTYVGALRRNLQTGLGRCPTCDANTCLSCKGAAHIGPCPEDAELELTLTTAREQGWQRCSTCQRLVELTTGCNHITCPCGSHFCYVCNRTWKTCDCPQWNEENLLARAEQVVARQGHGNVPEVAEGLRERHECDHGVDAYEWEFINNGGRCDDCGDTLHQFILRCPYCHVLMCRRCRDHRL